MLLAVARAKAPAASGLARQAHTSLLATVCVALLGVEPASDRAAASMCTARCVPTWTHTSCMPVRTAAGGRCTRRMGGIGAIHSRGDDISAVRCVRREFHAFHGSPQDFAHCVEAGPVMVFFYKAECVPCAEIRSKLVHAADTIVHAPAAQTFDDMAVEDEGRAVRGRQTAGGQLADSVEGRASDAHVASTHLPRSGEASSGKAGLDMSREDIKCCHDIELAAQLRFRRAMQCIRFLAVNTDENDRVTALHDVRSLPTFVAYLDGCIIGRVEGGRDSKVMQLLDELMAHVDSAR